MVMPISSICYKDVILTSHLNNNNTKHELVITLSSNTSFGLFFKPLARIQFLLREGMVPLNVYPLVYRKDYNFHPTHYRTNLSLKWLKTD